MRLDDTDEVAHLRMAAAILDFAPPGYAIKCRHPYHAFEGVRIPQGIEQKRDGKRIPHLVYVATCEGFAKIGVTQKIGCRISNLRMSCPFPIKVVAIMRGGRKLEKELHSRFAGHRHTGEWFRIEGSLAAWIATGCKD